MSIFLVLSKWPVLGQHWWPHLMWPISENQKFYPEHRKQPFTVNKIFSTNGIDSINHQILYWCRKEMESALKDEVVWRRKRIQGSPGKCETWKVLDLGESAGIGGFTMGVTLHSQRTNNQKPIRTNKQTVLRHLPLRKAARCLYAVASATMQIKKNIDGSQMLSKFV